MVNLCNTFFHWKVDDETNFRKLILDKIPSSFQKELDKFKTWNGEYKICKKCKRNLPQCAYYFKTHPQNKKDGLLNKCKECDGKRFSWGLKQKEIFRNNNQWYCAKCDTVYPLNEIYFARDKRRDTGFNVTCKRCATYSSEFGINRHLNDIVEVKENFQVCLECLIELPKTQEYYFKMKKHSNSFETKCKKCQGKEYGIVNWNSILDLTENEKFCTGCREIKNITDFYPKYGGNGTNSRCKKCHYISSQNRRHQQSSAEYTLEDWEFSLNYFKNSNGEYSCAYCGTVSEKLEKEHIIPFSKGGELKRSNIIPSCKSCNCTKNDKSFEEFYQYKTDFTEELYNKIIEYVLMSNDSWR